MYNIIDKFYKGYEGEPEIQFVKYSNNNECTILSIWDGYFDDIMRLFVPSSSGWQGLAYYYHMCLGWEANSPWEIPNLIETLSELENLDLEKLEFDKSSDVLLSICELIRSAISNDEIVSITKE